MRRIRKQTKTSEKDPQGLAEVKTMAGGGGTGLLAKVICRTSSKRTSSTPAIVVRLLEHVMRRCFGSRAEELAMHLEQHIGMAAHAPVLLRVTLVEQVNPEPSEVMVRWSSRHDLKTQRVRSQ